MYNSLGRNDICWCGSGKKYKKCHAEFDYKLQYYKSIGQVVPEKYMIKSEREIENIKKSAHINISVLNYVANNIKAGITTEQIDRWVYDVTVSMGGIPATLGYEGFTKSVCTSINHQVCHGIPSKDVVLKEGDIINVDASTILNGYFSDSSRMFCIGEVDKDKEKLVRIARECIDEGLKKVKPWGLLGDMGQSVYDYAQKNGYSVVREIGGHGIGLEFHEEPWIGYIGPKGTGMLMAPGMIFTIEPMINMGEDKIVMSETDGWTVYTADGKPSAQWEVMVLVTATGYEILAY